MSAEAKRAAEARLSSDEKEWRILVFFCVFVALGFWKAIEILIWLVELCLS